MTTPIGISNPCVKCGMERGGNLMYCPTCMLGDAIRDQNRGHQRDLGDSGWADFLGMLTGLALCGYFFYWLLS